MMVTERNKELSPEQNMNNTIKLIHITDLHLGDNLGDQLSAVDCDQSLLQILERVQNEEFDLLLITGDITNHGAVSAYQRLQEYLKDIAPKPIYLLPGNHDNWSNAEKVFQYLPKHIVLGDWQIILLDSNEGNHHYGQLSQQELQFLEQSLSVSQAKYSLIALHHHPVDIASPWMDAMRVKNNSEFFDIINRFSSPRAVVWGHIHQEFDKYHSGVRLLSSPSTCTQFMPMTEKHEKDTRLPGYRQIVLATDGSIETKVIRLAN